MAAALPALVLVRHADAAAPAVIRAAGPRLGDLRVRRAPWLAAGLALVAIAILLYLGRRLNFFGDEWTFVFVRRGSGAQVFFGPHNEHWSTLPVLIYRALFATVGLGTYWPYLVVLELLHAGSALLLFAIIRRRSGPALALGAMLVFLFLGRGAENILWAFQVGFVGSVFCGLLAILLLDGAPISLRRRIAASLALIASLMFSGMGLFFCGAIAVDLLIDRRRRSALVVLIAPALAYLWWFLTFGASGVTSHRSPLSLAAVVSLVHYVPFGLGAAIAGLAGFSSHWGEASLAVAAALLALSSYTRGRVDSRVVGALAGVMLQFAATGLVRAQFGDEQAAAPRYVYVAAAFLLPVVADGLAAVPWRGILGWAVVAAFALAFLNSVVHLRSFAQDRDAIIVLQGAELQTLMAFRGAPDMNLKQQIDPAVMPPVTAGAYFAAIDALGSPVPMVDVAGLRRLPGAAVNQAMVSAFGGALRTRPLDQAPSGGSCQTAMGESTAYSDVSVPSGGAVTIGATDGGPVSLWLSYLSDPVGAPQGQVYLLPGRQVSVVAPDTGTPIVWRLRISLPPAGQVAICP
jgi:hypothetical protein